MLSIVPREYQREIADKILSTRKNTLVVLPTGVGKTLIAALVIEEYLKNGGKAAFLAPTKPLVFQHAKYLSQLLGIEAVEITGEMRKEKRTALYDSSLIVSTPQTMKNDLMNFDFDFSVIVFDEAHRAIGKYAYTQIAEFAKKNGSLIIGLTASPGGKFEKIKKIMDALFIENVEIRTEKDIAKYIQPIRIKWIEVELSDEIKAACEILKSVLEEKKETLKALGIKVSKNRKKLSEIYTLLVSEKNLPALGHFSTFYNALHSIEILQTQSPYAYEKFFERLKLRKKRLDKRFEQARQLVKGKEHPKMTKLIEILHEREGKKVIIFAQYRDQVNHLKETLEKSGFRTLKLLGKKESSQKEQRKAIEAFGKEAPILICSSVGEEGIDLPSADTVIFYEPIPSEIRTIQRRGRVGRLKEGEVIILVTKGTLDETFKYVSIARERKMKKIVYSMREKGEKKLKKEKNEAGQQKLTDFIDST
jgi:Fanconi anemia group M protein